MRFVLVLPLAFTLGCGPKSNETSAGAPPAAPPPRAAEVVQAAILANGCQSLGRTNALLAERAMDKLVEGCTAVPGGTARFGATLLPGGQIRIAGEPGQSDVVPICVLKHPLVHQVPLDKPCRLDVSIGEVSVPVVDGGAAPSQ